MSELYCPDCGSSYPLDTREPACACGGLFDLRSEAPGYDPALVDQGEWSLFRYRRFMPLSGEAWRRVSMGEGRTPVVRLDGRTLLKLDYLMPTLSFKDRGAAVLAAHCAELGVERVVQDSSGNAGNAVAAYCARAGIACEIYVPEGTSPRKMAMIKAHGAALVVVPGSRDDTARACREAVRRDGAYYASHVFNPLFYEGTKTYLYEVYEQLGRLPGVLFIPVGNGTLFLGVSLALKELLAAGLIKAYPRVVAVQSERCAPLAEAAASGVEAAAPALALPTLAEGIAIGEPARARRILREARELGAEFALAPEADIVAAREALAAKGLYVEHTTAASYAAYLAWRKNAEGEADSDALIPLCGAGLKSDK